MPVEIPLGNLTLEVINHPRKLNTARRQRILRDLHESTQRAFGRPADIKEVREHTVGHKISTLILVKNAEDKCIGYYSTRAFQVPLKASGKGEAPQIRNVTYLAGSVLDPAEKTKGLFSVLQSLAVLLEDTKHVNAGMQVNYLAARTQSGRVFSSLRHHGLLPAAQNEIPADHKAEFETVWRALATRLGAGHAVEPHNRIIRGAFDRMLYPKINPAEFNASARVQEHVTKLDVPHGDAFLLLGDYRSRVKNLGFLLRELDRGRLGKALKQYFPQEHINYSDPERRMELINDIQVEMGLPRRATQWKEGSL